MPSAHAAVKHELLVRYLDAWLPMVLHRHKRVTYVDSSRESAVAAARVICEFEDLLSRHPMTMVVGAISSAADVLVDPPPGLTIHPAQDTLLGALRDVQALGSPIFAWLQGPQSGELLSTVAGNKATELVIAPADPAVESLLRKAGLSLVSQVELVDTAGAAELLLFATASEKSLEKFKDALWSLDEYAGIRLRDPHDADGTLLDISVQPHLGPLRRALLEQVTGTGGATLAELRTWTVHETIYRATDATKAVQSLITSGMASRVPIGGRLSPETLIQPHTEVRSDE